MAFTISSETPSVDIINVVVSTSAKGALNIELLSKNLRNVFYEPEIFAGLIHRREQPKATIIMFASGKITSVGSRSEEIGRKSIKNEVAEIGHIMGEEVALGSITTENVVVKSDVGCQLDIMKLAAYSSKAKYEPSKFPGVIYTLRSKVKVLIFTSGKIILVGAKSENQAKSSMYKIHSMLKMSGCLVKPTV